MEAIGAGHGFKIIELNGVTSEATHIYHPGTPLTQAYGVLMTQWRTCAIVRQNRCLQPLGGAPLAQREIFASAAVSCQRLAISFQQTAVTAPTRPT